MSENMMRCWSVTREEWSKHHGCFLLVILLSAIVSSVSFGATKVSTASGNWNTAGTWSPSGVPGAGDAVAILSGHNVTLDVNGTCGVLNVIGTLTYSNTANRTLTITTSGNVFEDVNAMCYQFSKHYGC